MTIILIDVAIAWILSFISSFFSNTEYKFKTTLNSLAILWLSIAVLLLAKKVS